tara:strand:- start:5100 stop:6161 length:1062 start_codon:yes stop_codon:yes gene_type:complete
MRTLDTSVKIKGREIGLHYPPYIIAELSANHNGSLERAKRSVKIAKEMGADAVKFQTYTPDTLTIDSDKEDFKIKGGLWDGFTLYELYKSAFTPFEWHKDLFSYSKSVGITCFSTPFDESAVDLLEDLNTPAYKVASFEIIDLPLIKYIARTKKPLIISTGMANKEEIQEAVEVAKENGSGEIVLLHCISGYPTPVEQSNLMTIPDMISSFNSPIGLSDHTLGIEVSIASIALGASVIEKHFTIDSSDKGPDSEFSLEPDQLKDLCIQCKSAWQALGKAGYERKEVEEQNIKFRRSIYAVKDIEFGEVLTKENIRRIRPGYGLSPKYFNDLIGKKASLKIERGTPLSWDMIEK